MRKFYIFALVATMFAACATDGVNEPSAVIGDLAPETLTVSFEGEESRIQLQEGKTVWNEGDLVSVFYRSNANQKWQFQGATGDRTGNLKRVEMGTATETMNRVVVVYPYAENYYINPETYNIEASLPAQQTYVADSYGIGGNIMVSYGEYNQVVLKSVCGWLKLELTGNGESIKSITLKGNNGEQVAGQLYINSADATAVLASEMGGADDNGSAGGNLVFDDTILTEVTLNCGEGVTLNAEPTAFYIALPPQTFAKGISLEIIAADDSKMTKSTDKEVVIERNHILPMEAFGVEFPIPETWKIYYNAASKVEPYYKTVFGATYVANEWNEATGEGVITFDSDVTSIGRAAFYYCSSLTSVTIPDSVTSIGENAFHSCKSLKSIIIPDSVTEIGTNAFAMCFGLTDITIGNNVKTISNEAFSECTQVTQITIPDSVSIIGEQAFNCCYKLESISIGRGVTIIRSDAFAECNKLSSIHISDLAAWCNVKCTSIPYGKGINLYLNNELITDLVIPDGVKIMYVSFEGYKALQSVIIPDSVTEFYDYQVFAECENLKRVVIGAGMIKLRGWTFSYCSNLEEVYCKAITPPQGSSFFSNSGSGYKIYVPRESVDAYKAADGWSDYASDIIGYDF